MEFHVWLAFASASIALLLIPGPTVLLVLSYAISQGKRVAVATAAGVALGLAIEPWDTHLLVILFCAIVVMIILHESFKKIMIDLY